MILLFLLIVTAPGWIPFIIFLLIDTDFLSSCKNLISKVIKWFSKINWRKFSRRTRHHKNGYATISFEKFLDLYSINPDKWSFDTYYNWDINARYNYGKGRSIFYFSTKADERLFKRWVKKEENRKKNLERYSAAYEDMQNDIELKMIERQKEQKNILSELQKTRAKQAQEYIDAERRLQQLARGGH